MNYRIPTHAIAVASALLLAACSQTPPQKTEATTSSRMPNPTSNGATTMMSGYLILGSGAGSFQPCGSTQQYEIAMDELQQSAVVERFRDANQPLYAELGGSLNASLSSGLSQDYVGQFQVTEINFVASEYPSGCRTHLESTKANGNEPSWTMLANNQSLTYSRMGEPSQRYALEQATLGSDERRYRFADGSLTLYSTLCFDTMSDAVFGWSASANIGNNKLSGCARLPNQDSSLKWQGQYGAQSTKNLGFAISLSLGADHIAVTEYQYADGSQATREVGYWQQLSDQQVEVVSTIHQGQRLIAKRIYSKRNNTLVATQETVNGTTYTLQDGGIVLFEEN